MDRIDEGNMHPVEQIAEACGGRITEAGALPDGSGFAIMSMPLPKNHWIYQKDDTPAGFRTNVPPMPFRMGNGKCFMVVAPELNFDKNGPIDKALLLDREQMKRAINAAGKYAVRCATMNGTDMDFDPDALLQNLVVGFLGYWTKDGLTGDPEDARWCDPQQPFDFGHPDPPARWCPTCVPDGSCTAHATGNAQPSADPPPSEG